MQTYLEAERQPDGIEAKGLDSQHNVSKIQRQRGAASPKPIWTCTIRTELLMLWSTGPLWSQQSVLPCSQETFRAAAYTSGDKILFTLPKVPEVQLHIVHAGTGLTAVGTRMCITCRTQQLPVKKYASLHDALNNTETADLCCHHQSQTS